MHDFDREYWEQHWHERADQHGTAHAEVSPANPYLAEETASLTPGTALDAGCGTGTEAIWLAAQGWRVTGADISSTALKAARTATAVATANDPDLPGRLTWVEADLTSWQPDQTFDLVVTNYAHPSIPQLEFYARIADWVSPGGTLLIIGHLHNHSSEHAAEHTADHSNKHSNEHAAERPDDLAGEPTHPPVESTVRPQDITALLAPNLWRIETAEEHHRALGGNHPLRLHDAVVRATRIAERE